MLSPLKYDLARRVQRGQSKRKVRWGKGVEREDERGKGEMKIRKQKSGESKDKKMLKKEKEGK